MPQPARPRRRSFQFGLRGLFAFIVVVAIGAAWVGYERRQSRKEMRIAEQLVSQGASVSFTGRFFYSDEFDPVLSPGDPVPSWWRKKLSTVCGQRIRSVSLAGHWCKVNDLTLLAGLTCIRELDINFAPIKDLTPIAGLQSLERFGILPVGDREIDIGPLGGLTNLRHLELFVHVDDVAPLAALTELEHLILHIDELSDLTPIAGLKKLKHLDLTRTGVRDLTPIAGLTNLQRLDLTQSLVADFAPIAGFEKLETLYLYDTPGRELSPLVGLENLRNLHVSHVRISDTQVAVIKSALPNCKVWISMNTDPNAPSESRDDHSDDGVERD